MLDSHNGVYKWSHFPHESEESLQEGDASATFFDYVDEQGDFHSLQMIHYNIDNCLVEEYYADKNCGELYFDFQTRLASKLLLIQKESIVKLLLLEGASFILMILAVTTMALFSVLMLKTLTPDRVTFKTTDPRAWGIILISFSFGAATAIPAAIVAGNLSKEAEDLWEAKLNESN